MAVTVPYDYSGSTESRHTAAAQTLAKKLGWSGLWIGGGAPSEDGYQYVNVGKGFHFATMPEGASHFGIEGSDWFYVA